ncbi:MAG: hypothetical protein U0O22_01705 [Acutalibacteraceae bacterium]|nr:hypothetical protein [Acutalibacteraceae bacterium]
MIVKLLGFNAQEFIISQRASYQEKLQMFKRQKQKELLFMWLEIILVLSIMCQFLYYIRIKNSVISSLGIILVGISVGILLKNKMFDNIYFSEQPKEDFEFEFIQAILKNKNIISAEIVYDTIWLQYNLRFTYNNNEQKCSYIKIILKEKKDIDELWYDLSSNTLYVPQEKFNLVKYKLKIPVETFFTENINLRNILKEEQEV